MEISLFSDMTSDTFDIDCLFTHLNYTDYENCLYCNPILFDLICDSSPESEDDCLGQDLGICPVVTISDDGEGNRETG
jgi:hypothetical protein